MHGVIAFLKPVVTRNAPSAVAGSYIFRDGQVWAARPGMIAGMPVPSLLPIDANVPAEELEGVVSRMKEAPSLSLGDDGLHLSGGRLRGFVIAVRHDEPPPLPDASMVDFAPCPPDLPAWLRLAAEHVGTRGWTSGMRLMDGRITAINDVSGVDIDAVGLRLAAPVLLIEECASFVAGAGAPAEIGSTPTALYCRWADGRWLQSSVLNAEMSTRVEEAFEKATEEHGVEVTAEWREAFDDAKSLSDGFVDLRPDGFHVNRGALRGPVAFDTGLPDGHASRWSTRTLGPVLARASRFHPGGGQTGQPCRFSAPGFRGVVMAVAR